MKRKILVCPIILTAFLFTAPVSGQNSITNVVTNQGGKFRQPCDTTNLSAETFWRVAYDNAGQPCARRGSQTGQGNETCDPTTPWNYSVHGHLTFKTAPGYDRSRVEVRVYVGGGGGECSGGQTTTCPDLDKPGHHYLVEDSTFNIIGADTNISVPFDAVEINLPAYFTTPGDGNYQGFWIFAKSIGTPVICTYQYFTSEEHN